MHLHGHETNVDCLAVLPIVWSDDDWLKKFSGKKAEESEEAESAAESASTETQEVRKLQYWFIIIIFI